MVTTPAPTAETQALMDRSKLMTGKTWSALTGLTLQAWGVSVEERKAAAFERIADALDQLIADNAADGPRIDRTLDLTAQALKAA